VGEPVVFDSPEKINLSGSPDFSIYKEWKPELPPVGGNDPAGGGNGSGSLFAYGGNEDGSLTVAGNADVRSGQITAPGGFTVWGVLENKGDSVDTSGSGPITSGNTPVTAWTARLKGVSFGGKVSLLGSITNTFGPSVSFDGHAEISGPSMFNNARFEKGAKFNGTVTFAKDETATDNKPVVFKGEIVFADNAYLHDAIDYTGPTKITFYKKIDGVPYNDVAKYFSSGDSSSSVGVPLTTIEKPTEGGGSFGQNMVFTAKEVTVKDEVKFAKDVTFEGNVTFNGKPSFGTVSTTFSGGSQTTTIIKGLAVFEDGADFGGTLGNDNKPTSNTVIIEEAEFKAGGEFKNITNLKLGNSSSPAVVFTAGVAANFAGSGAITIDPEGGITFKDDTLTFTGKGGTLGAAVDLNNATVELVEGAKMTFNQGGGAIEVMQAGTGGGAFKIEGKANFNMGEIKGDGKDVALKATGGVVLKIPGGPGIPNDLNYVAVNNALVDLSEGGAIVFAGTASRIVLTNNANIKTGLGLAIPKGQTVSEGVIIAGADQNGSASLLTGTLNNTNAGSLSGGTYTSGADISGSGATVFINVLNKGNGFIVVNNTAVAGSTSASGLGTTSSIAVFTSQGQFAK
jgi:hypothetical protein